MGDRATAKHRIQPTTRGVSKMVGEEVTCVFCEEVIRETSCVMTSCGHPVCPSCLDELSNGASKCPIDGTLINRNNVRMTSLIAADAKRTMSSPQREILFRCPNKDKCDQLLPMELLQEHLVKCLQSKSTQQTSVVHAIGPASAQQGVKSMDGGDVAGGVSGSGQVIMRPPSTNSKRRPLSMTSADVAMASMGEQRQQIEFLRDSILTIELRVDRLLQVVKDGMMGLQESSNTVKTQLNAKIEELEKQMKEFAEQMSKTTKQMTESMDFKKTIACEVEEVCYDGVLVWKVEGYSRLKMSERCQDLCSQPFYSSHFGYKMCLAVDVQGDGTGRGNHVSIYLCMMKGKYDDVLNWPFQQKVTFLLLDQRESREKMHIARTLVPDYNWPEFSRPLAERNVGRGYHRFVAHDVIESRDSCYLKNDCIYIKALVDDTIIL